MEEPAQRPGAATAASALSRLRLPLAGIGLAAALACCGAIAALELPTLFDAYTGGE